MSIPEDIERRITRYATSYHTDRETLRAIVRDAMALAVTEDDEHQARREESEARENWDKKVRDE